jgi:hypothetical protein
LAEGAAFVELFEFSNSRNQDAEQLHDSQESQESQNAQINRDEGLQVKRRHRQEVDDGEWAGHKAQAGVFAIFKLFVLWSEVKAQTIFNREHRDLVLNKMHAQLADEKSYLMLGSSESIFSETTQYQNLRIGRGSVYRKSPG